MPGEQRRWLRPRHDSRRRNRLRPPARRYRGAGDVAGARAAAQGAGLRLGTGLPGAHRQVQLRDHDPRAPLRGSVDPGRLAWTGASVSMVPGRVVACCGHMVINGGLRRMTYEILRAVNQNGGTSHAIVNGWENFRITPEIEACGSSWSVGPYYYSLKRRGLSPIVVAKMVLEIARVSADLIRVSRRFRPTHVFVPDFVVVLRNAPALAWLRLRGVVVVLGLQNAPPPGRFYRHLWAHVINPLVDRLVANSEFTRREH